MTSINHLFALDKDGYGTAEKRRRYDNLYMNIAAECAEMSHAKRLQVGCVIVKDGAIISHGWNGMPAGMENICETPPDEGFQTKIEVQHAEENAVLKLARSNQSSADSTAYITHAPCIYCAKMLYGARITRVVFGEAYRDTLGLDFLTGLGVVVCRA